LAQRSIIASDYSGDAKGEQMPITEATLGFILSKRTDAKYRLVEQVNNSPEQNRFVVLKNDSEIDSGTLEELALRWGD